MIMNSKKGFALTMLILIVVVILAAIGGIWYYEGRGGGAASTKNTPSSGTLATTSPYGLTMIAPSGTVYSSQNTNADYYSSGNDFIDPSGAIFLGEIDIPNTLYPGTSFKGASFSASVSTSISNKATCDEITDSKAESVSEATINGITYMESDRGGAAAGTESDTQTLHTFKNGFCYELSLNTLISGSPDGSFADYTAADVTQLQNMLFNGISFSTPTTPPPSGKNAAPSIVSFQASSMVAEGGPESHSSNIVFSWTASNADYVRLSFTCPTLNGSSGILQASFSGTEEGCPTFTSSTLVSRNYPPNSSTTIFFDLYNNPTLSPSPLVPASVTLELEPFANGVGSENLKKTITITVNPD
jgi:hypothetical protein